MAGMAAAEEDPKKEAATSAPRDPAGAMLASLPAGNGPVFLGRSVKLGTLTWSLRPEVKFEDLLAWQETSIEAGEAFAVIASAVDALQNARGDFENLVDRARKTVRAKRLADSELDRLEGIFVDLYQPAGIREVFNTPEKFTELVRGTIENFPRGGK